MPAVKNVHEADPVFRICIVEPANRRLPSESSYHTLMNRAVVLAGADGI